MLVYAANMDGWVCIGLLELVSVRFWVSFGCFIIIFSLPVLIRNRNAFRIQSPNTHKYTSTLVYPKNLLPAKKVMSNMDWISATWFASSMLIILVHYPG